MGDRVSISFRRGTTESVVLFSHWGGMGFVQEAQAYSEELVNKTGDSTQTPLDRLEPETVIVDFIHHLTADKSRIRSNYYLGQTPKDGDNSDNGHHVIELPVKGW